MSLAISKFKSIFKNQICHKSCKIHAYKFAFHGEHSVQFCPKELCTLYRASLKAFSHDEVKAHIKGVQLTGPHKVETWRILPIVKVL